MAEKVITRFPPSPTGYLHIGGVRTALFNYLFTTHNKGEMKLRFEDTDRERSKKEYEDDITQAMQWLGLPYVAQGIVRQSERTEIYKKYIPKLVDTGHAFEAEEAKDGGGKKVVRFKNPNKTVTFYDNIRGEVTFDTAELKDFVVARSIEEPLYHLAVVIDDFEMGVTHVIRGEDHISNTPRQILILEGLGFTRPEYAHIPLILAPDKTKLSKRHGAVSVNEYRAQGYIPEAMLNYLALLGWNPGGERELFTVQELTQEFTLDRVHKNGAVFDIEKLKWFNHEHIKRLSDADFSSRLKKFSGAVVNPRLVPLIKERAQTLAEAVELLQEYNFLDTPVYDPALLLQKGKLEKNEVIKHLKAVSGMLGEIPDREFNKEKIKEVVFPYATAGGRGVVLWPMRVALSGREKSPDPFALAGLIGKEKTLERIEKAAKVL